MDPDTRLNLMTRQETMSDGRLHAFYTSRELGAAYAAPGKGYGRPKHIASAMTAADRRGDGDEVLLAAAKHFGLLDAEQSDDSEDDESKSDEADWLTALNADPSSDASMASLASPPSAEAELCRLAFEAWDQKGEWPIASILQRKLERDGSRIDVEMVARGLDRDVGYLEQQHNGRLVLRIGGLMRIPAAKAYVSAFIEAVQLAYRLYVGLDTDETSVLTDELLRTELSLDPDIAWRLYTLLDGESVILWSGGSTPEEQKFRRDISPSIRHFRDVRDGPDYITAANSLRRPFSDMATATSTAPSGLRRGPSAQASAPGQQASQIYNFHMFGGIAAFGPYASVQTGVTPGDLTSLMDFLSQQGIEEAERRELADALEADKQAVNKEPGRRVIDWLERASMTVAASGGRIGEGTAAAVIGAAIARYLGI
jgi:hypothetical protein